MKITLYELIKDGYDRDIVVYDQESKILSKRLLCLMIQKAKRIQDRVEPIYFYIDKEATADLMSQFSSYEEWPDGETIKTIFGIKIIFVDGLDGDYDESAYINYYKDIGGSFPSSFDKKSLVVLASENKALLGCY
jgi:hypothetical protein